MQITGMQFGAKITQANQLSGAKVFFTGTSGVFSATTQCGTTLAGPTGGIFDFEFTTPVSVPAGTYYF